MYPTISQFMHPIEKTSFAVKLRAHKICPKNYKYNYSVTVAIADADPVASDAHLMELKRKIPVNTMYIVTIINVFYYSKLRLVYKG